MSKTNGLIKLVTPEVDKLPEFLKTIETKWSRRSLNLDGPANNAKPRYILSMFPYPSGRLHLGHVRIYTSGDILARFSRLLSRNEKYSSQFNHVINPMGFDSFGLPAENAAKERGLDPVAWTNSNIRTMKRQLDDLALQFDWREATSNPSYYKWTQDIFLKLFNAGLAYKSYARVNWDPADRTVLADEQVDENGCSWRSGALIEKRIFKQWFIKVNAFANAIYEAEDVQPESWRDILAIQRNWIGQPTGWLFYLPITIDSNSETLLVFTRNPELFLKKDTKLVIAESHWLNEVHQIPEGFNLRNPFNGGVIEVSTIGETNLPEGCQATLVSGSLVNYDELLEERVLERDQVLMQAKLHNLGGYFTSDKYRDWLVSRQRFWGTPIPVMKCNNCGLVGANQESLPVKLPSVKSINHPVASDDCASTEQQTIISPIEQLAPESWLDANCPSCGSKAKRECDTLDTLFDSSWYFLRYATSPPNDQPYDRDQVMPVWCYIGGKEHASMHLFYARFVTHFLHSQGLLKFREPFSKLMVQGVVKSRTYKNKDGEYLTKSEIDSMPDKSTLQVEYEKMSKSKGNGVDPEHLLERYGVDATRFCLMSYVNPRTERLWRSEDEEFKDVLIYLRRVILTMQEYESLGAASSQMNKTNKKMKELTESELESKQTEMRSIRNRCLSRAMYHIQDTYQFRQYISVIHTLLVSLRANLNSTAAYSEEFAQSLASLLVIQSPLTPHLSGELWVHFCNTPINPLRNNNQKSNFKMDRHVFDQAWPLSDEDAHQ